MNSYLTYQCTVCRRTKDILRDDRRVIPTACTITKGCAGVLFKVGEKTVASPTPSIPGVIDWYPRTSQPASQEPVVQDQLVPLSTSRSNALVVALRIPDPLALSASEITLLLEQRKVEAVSFQQFTFRPQVDSTEFTGRDSTGRNLRVDQSAIVNDRVTVRVNGVQVFNFTLSQFNLVFSSPVRAGSVVDVIVYAEKTTVEKVLTFSTNRSIVQNTTTGAWSNVRWMTNGLTTEKWWLYTCTSLGVLDRSSTAKIISVNRGLTSIPLEDCLFLLASAPFSHIDRYIEFASKASLLGEDYNLQVSDERQVLTRRSLITDLYPPLKIEKASLTNDDIIPENSGAIPTDSASSFLKNKIINGKI